MFDVYRDLLRLNQRVFTSIRLSHLQLLWLNRLILTLSLACDLLICILFDESKRVDPITADLLAGKRKA